MPLVSFPATPPPHFTHGWRREAARDPAKRYAILAWRCSSGALASLNVTMRFISFINSLDLLAYHQARLALIDALLFFQHQ
jgi:hypothetical protein